MTQTRTLKSDVRRIAIKWSVLGVLLVVFLTLPMFVNMIQKSAERELTLIAKTMARSFRPSIIGGDIRDVQFQIERLLSLTQEESVLILNPQMKPIYSMNKDSESVACQNVEMVCWGKRFGKMSILWPIYFDEDSRSNLLGYISLTLTPNWDMNDFFLYFSVILMIFAVLAFGILSALGQSIHSVSTTLAGWSDRLKFGFRNGSPTEGGAVPYLELAPVEGAIQNLSQEVEELRQRTIKETQIQTQWKLLQDVTHDIKTPVGTLGKLIPHLLSDAQNGVSIHPEYPERIQRSLRQIRDLVKQVGHVPPPNQITPAHNRVEIAQEIRTYISDIQVDEEVLRRGVKFDLSLVDHMEFWIAVDSISFYRLLDNLVRNAVQAVPESGGIVSILVSSSEEDICLRVKDNGCGVSPEHQPKMFDFSFTTKAARGTGLGLGIIKRICDAASAKISTQTAPNEGMCVEILFPRLKATSQYKNEIQGVL